MANIPALNWSVNSDSAILFDENPVADAWHSGRATDLLHISGNRLLVGTNTGGLWLAESDGVATPLSDAWTNPNVICLAQVQANTFLCGTEGALYENNPDATSKTDPLGPWQQITLPPEVFSVNRIVVLRDGNLVVIATDAGIFWTQHVRGRPVIWHAATWLRRNGQTESLPGQWSDIAASDGRIIAGADYSPPVDTLLVRNVPIEFYDPITVGSFGADGLRFEASAIKSAHLEQTARVTIGTCDGIQRIAYAALFGPDGTVFNLLRSDDGGMHWRRLADTLRNGPDGIGHDTTNGNNTLTAFAGDELAGTRLKRIMVHPELPDVVSFSGKIGFVSEDGGDTWLALGGNWKSLVDGVYTDWEFSTRHLHVDHHTIIFSPTPESPNRIFLATDGGVFDSTDWHDPDQFRSHFNKGLLTLQFLSPAGNIGGVADESDATFPGSTGSTPSPRGITAGGLQDNGNVWKQDNARGIWRSVEHGGDGGFNLTVGLSGYCQFEHADDTPFETAKGTLWNGADALTGSMELPITNGEGNWTMPTMLAGMEPVNYPDYQLNGRLMRGVAWNDQGIVFGLFTNQDGGDAWFVNIGSVPVSPDYPVFSAASYDGHEILVTTGHNIFKIDSTSGSSSPMTIGGDKPSVFGFVNRLVATSKHDGFAAIVVDDAESSPGIARRTGDTSWEFIPSPPPDPLSSTPGKAFGMDADDCDPLDRPVLLVATESRIWATADLGDHWADVSNGLPTSPHCTDLRYNRFKRRWTLGTYGRSMWQAGNLVRVGVSSLIRSDYPKNAEHYNFEALVLLGDELFHYYKDNSNVENRWTRSEPGPITRGVTAPACLVRSDSEKGAEHLNFDALVLKGNELSHWSRNNSTDPGAWYQVSIVDVASFVPGGATGPASMVVSDYLSSDGRGNFAALIPTQNGLFHFWRDQATGKWQPASSTPLTVNPGSSGCIISTDYFDGSHRGLEALVFEPFDKGVGTISHFKWHPDVAAWIWTARLVDDACAPACLIQSDYLKGAQHKNLEALVPRLRGGQPALQHFSRSDNVVPTGGAWQPGRFVSRQLVGSASMVQSDFHQDPDHGNFEAVFAEVGNDLWHVYCDQAPQVWLYAGTVT
ncbi:hypothetical protein [Paraburkholderia atlantica]|uniref:hypothetical protein n=1 Tax=Paraburkholderia atlantica TaxID=2654982 RepID=UPI00160AED37|nr:hypothetical protein [Paraburkholderia atlantica]MBB5510857.1 hypothetical protein [Paraburkholderia atlantica]